MTTALTEKQREAVEMFFFEGLSQSEIARKLGVSQQVIQKRLYGDKRGGVMVGGAVAKLREALAYLCAEPRPEGAEAERAVGGVGGSGASAPPDHD